MIKIEELAKWCEENGIKFYHKTWIEGNPMGELVAETPDGRILRRSPATEIEQFKRDIESWIN